MNNELSRTDLDVFLENEAAAELRSERVEIRARDLMQKGQEFCPWTFEHFEEAMGNATEGQRKAMFAQVAYALYSFEQNLVNTGFDYAAVASIYSLIEDYWYGRALYAANRIEP